MTILIPDDLLLQFQAALAGEYSIERELGRGGMGVVYLAREVRLAREVAIKLLPPELATDQEAREQFVREAQTAARLSHPNIVPIHRVDESGGFVYFVMAYVAGETLAERVRRRGPLSPHQAARVLREVAWALTYAHTSGIVHRDVKADNILLERGTDRALVTDFGIAAGAHANARTRDGRIAGTPHYASPEQISGEPVDAASDIYSLGVVGFLVLTGRLPFDASTPQEILTAHLSMSPPAVSAIAPTVPAVLGQIVERCLAKRPEKRFASASALAEALERSVAPTRETPAPLRVWLAHSNSSNFARIFLGAYLPFAVGTPFGIVAASSGILGVVRLIRRKNASDAGKRQIKFYESAWGERLLRIAGIGVKRRAAISSPSLLTEVAIGRASDALYAALPKTLRSQLRELPAVVRCLENDATALRVEIENLDLSIGALDGDARGESSSALAGSPHGASVRAERAELSADLVAARSQADDRLASTVAALENIRLNLLRLQLGRGRVESVTESIAAAQHVAEDIGVYVDAFDEVEATLSPTTTGGSPRGLS